MFYRKRLHGNDTCGFSSKPQFKYSILGIASAAVGGIGSLVGGIASSKAMRQAQQAYDTAHQKNQAYYQRLQNENYLDTTAGQETIRKAREMLQDTNNQAAGAAAFGGATDNSAALAREQANNTVGNMMSSIAANDTATKQAAGNALATENNTYAANTAQLKTKKAQQIAQAASGVANAASGIISHI